MGLTRWYFHGALSKRKELFNDFAQQIIAHSHELTLLNDEEARTFVLQALKDNHLLTIGNVRSEQYLSRMPKVQYLSLLDLTIRSNIIRNKGTSLETLKSLIPTAEMLKKRKGSAYLVARELMRVMPPSEERDKVFAMVSPQKNQPALELIAYYSPDPDLLSNFIFGDNAILRDLAALNPASREEDKVFVILALGCNRPKKHVKAKFDH